MKAEIIRFTGLVGSWGQARAEPLVEGRVGLDSGARARRAGAAVPSGPSSWPIFAPISVAEMATLTHLKESNT